MGKESPQFTETEQQSIEEQRISHQQRWQKQADEFQNRSVIRKIVESEPADPEMLLQWCMESEAWRENQALDRERSEFAEKLRQGCYEVLKAIRKIETDPEGEGKEVNGVLLLPGGGEGGNISNLVIEALQKRGYLKNFKTVIGMSVGSVQAAFALADQIGEGKTLLNEVSAKPGFYTPHRIITRHILKDKRPPLDLDRFFDVVKSKLNVNALIENLKKNKQKFLIYATNMETNEPELLNVNEGGVDPNTALHASSAIYVYYGKKIEIQGQIYGDGGIYPIPTEDVLEKVEKSSGKPVTHMFVIPHVSLSKAIMVKETVPNKSLIGILKSGLPQPLADIVREITSRIPLARKIVLKTKLATTIASMDDQVREAIHSAEKHQNVKIGILMAPEGPTDIKILGNKPEDIEASGELGKKYIEEILDQIESEESLQTVEQDRAA